MRKSLFLIPLVVTGLGGAYALVANLFPDTPLMPRIPMEVGSFGYSLAKVLGVTDLVNYAGDGTVKNSTALGGVAGTGYLQNMDCSAGYVWTRIDSAGRAVCELKSGDLLAKLGNITEVNGVTEIQRVGSSDFITANVGDEIIEGDIVRTAPGARTSIAFIDGSILRLDIDTTVELSVGKNSSNQAIAQVILNNGSLWGRVLTSTGVNIGTKEFIAGVRGTSVALKTNASFTTFSVVQSQNSPAAEITTTGSQTKTSMGTGASFTIYGGTTSALAVTTPGVTSLYSQSWIRDNVVKDIDYMNTLTGTTDTLLRDKVIRELAITLPSANSSESDALCADDGSQIKLVYWSSLVGTTNTKCQDDALLAFADYTKNTNTLYQKSGETLQANTNAVAEIDRGITIGTGQYLRYDATYLLGLLSGKSLVIELTNPLSLDTANIKRYLFDGGSIQYWAVNGNCGNGSTGKNICKKVGSTITNTPYNGTDTVFTLDIPVTPSQFIVGSVYFTVNGTYTSPLSNMIRNITVR